MNVADWNCIVVVGLPVGVGDGVGVAGDGEGDGVLDGDGDGDGVGVGVGDGVGLVVGEGVGVGVIPGDGEGVGVGVIPGDGEGVGVGVGVTPAPGVRQKSSTPNPSSAPAALKSFQRIQNVVPLAIACPVIVNVTAKRFAGKLPSNAPTVPAELGALKSSWSTSVHVPVVRLVASVLYWKSSRSVRPVAPSRHCSPVYVIASEPTVWPVLLAKTAPTVGINEPL
jgi:hypothetical protein